MECNGNISAGSQMMQGANMESVGRGGYQGGYQSQGPQAQEFASMMQGAGETGRSGGCGGGGRAGAMMGMDQNDMEDFLRNTPFNGSVPQNTNSITPTNNNMTTGGAAANGTFQLGNTSISVEGGTAAQRARIEENFTAMYNNDAAFRNVIDSKAGGGISVGFTEYTDNTAGMAAVGGNDMTMDNTFMNEGGDDIVAEVIAHEVGHLAGMNHGPALDNFAKTAGQTVA